MSAHTATRSLTRGNIIGDYLECALWASTDDEENPLDSTGYEVADETLQRMRDDCAAFFFQMRRELRETRGTLEQHAHDFWLTRNRHGAGFLDRGYGPVGARLSEWTQTFGSVDLYVGDDGTVYAA